MTAAPGDTLFAGVITCGTVWPTTRSSPHGYHDRATIERDLAAAGFAAPQIDAVAARSRARSARDVAIAVCRGTPMRGEIEARGPSALQQATDAAAAAVAQRFGAGPIDGKMQALGVTVTKP